MNTTDTLRIGVVGYCPPSKFNQSHATDYLRRAYDSLDTAYSQKKKIVVSGLTNVGVLALAYQEAHSRGWKTAGVACEKAYEYKEQWFPVDEEPVIVGQNWGDESETFLKTIDVLLRIGGGNQSRAEAARMRELKKPVFEYDLEAL